MRIPRKSGRTTGARAAAAAVALLVGLEAARAEGPDTLWLDQADLSGMTCGWRSPGANLTVEGNVLSIGGVPYFRGIGTHAISTWLLHTDRKAERFGAWVGLDDESQHPSASVEFLVLGDARVLWRSGPMASGQPALRVDLDVSGVTRLGLLVTDAGDGVHYDHADWAEAFLLTSGGGADGGLTAERLAPAVVPAAPVILTPPPPREPRINGPSRVGARPGHPVLHSVPVTGDRPMRFAASGLPPGLVLDSATGRIAGVVESPGEFAVEVTASNERGSAARTLTLLVGEEIALTPPLGWNSWNCWGGGVTAEAVLAAARAMRATGLADHGWSYVNIDDGWQGVRGGPHHAIQGNRKFPDMQALADSVHALGLKIGIYSTPWVGTYEGHVGGSADDSAGTYDWIAEGRANKNMRHVDYARGRQRGWRLGKVSFARRDVRQWAEWGIDYLKYDWNPIDVPQVREMADALRESGRDIVLSLSNSTPFSRVEPISALAQCWRTTGDIRDTWESVSSIGFSQDRWRPYARPGHWNDPDMLVVGLLGWGGDLRPTRLTPDEQYAHISLWSLLAAPLLLGNDLERLDEFTLSLLTNDEVLAVNQDPLGRQAGLVRRGGGIEVWSRELEDGSRAVGVFRPANDPEDPASFFSWEGGGPTRVSLRARDLGLRGKVRVRDLWRQTDLGTFNRDFSVEVPWHGVVLVRVWQE